MTRMTRRGFITGCSAGIAALTGSRFNTVAFGDPGTSNEEILIHVFLRGGMDGLNFLPPIGGVDRGLYEAARPDLKVATTGSGAALDLNGQFGLHPSAAPLYDLYQDNKLSIVQAVGLDEPTRSHFDAMRFIELGTPGSKTETTGWLARHLQSATNLPAEIIMPALAVGHLEQVSQLGSHETIGIDNVDDFGLTTGPWNWRAAQRTALRRLYGGDSTWLHEAGVRTLDALDIVELNAAAGYTPAGGAVYPSGEFGDHLQVVAQMMKLDLGLRVATLDLGGWDTHEGQGEGSAGYFANLVGELASGLSAFYTDLDGAGAENYTGRLTVVVQSEFGRRLRENTSGGTDHGHGNLMMVLSGNATGGLHGVWPGLAAEQLFDNADLAVTTDYRQVLAEILVRRLCNGNLETVFPSFPGYQPLGVVQGSDDAAPSDTIFSDGFESGGLGNWSS